MGGKEKSKPESEADVKQREEATEKRREIEKKLDITQDLEEVKPKNMEDVENYGEESDAEEAEEEKSENEEAGEEDTSSAEPVSELEILKTKLAKARKAVAKDPSQRKEAVERIAKKKKKMEESVDLAKIAREAVKEEEKEARKKAKLDAKFGDGEEETVENKSVGTKEKAGTS